MKNVSSGLGKDLNEYAKRAINTVWNSVSDGIGSIAYSSALKTPYLTRYEIVHGSNNGILDVGANSLGIGNSVDRNLRNELFAGRRKSVEYWGKELEAGRISKTERDIKVAVKIRNLENRYENKLEKLRTDILPVAFNNFLEGIPDEHVVSDDKRYKGLVAASKVSREAGLPSGLASAFLGKYGSILVVEPPRSTPPTNKFAEKKVYEVHEPGFVEREFYKIADKVFKYPMKAISKAADLMIEHPLLVGAATITGIAGAAGVYKYNTDKNFQKWADGGASKITTGISGGAVGIFGGIEGLFKGNQPPVADFEIKGNLTEGSPINIMDKSYDSDGKIVKTELRVDGVVTPTPTQTLSQGKHAISLTVYDDGGKSGTISKIVNLKERPPRTDIKVILGTARDDVLPSILNVARYFNESQKVPNENIKILKGNEFTYENFLKTVKEVGMSASDTDTIIINPSNDGGKGFMEFSKEGIKFNYTDGRTVDCHSYKMIAEAIKTNTNPNAEKVIFINACYSGSAVPIFKEARIPNSAIITDTTENTTASASSQLDILLTGKFSSPHIDYNKDGKISVKELVQLQKELSEKSWKNFIATPQGSKFSQEDMIMPQIWDPDNITDRLVLVDK